MANNLQDVKGKVNCEHSLHAAACTQTSNFHKPFALLCLKNADSMRIAQTFMCQGDLTCTPSEPMARNCLPLKDEERVHSQAR